MSGLSISCHAFCFHLSYILLFVDVLHKSSYIDLASFSCCHLFMASFDCYAFSAKSPEYCTESDCAYDNSSDVDIVEGMEPLRKRRKTGDDPRCNRVKPERLFELAADVVSSKIPFKTVEQYRRRCGRKVPEKVIFAIIRKAFPTDEDMVGLCASLSRPYFDSDEFYCESNNSEIIVKDVMQTGKIYDETSYHAWPLKLKMSALYSTATCFQISLDPRSLKYRGQHYV